MLAIVTRKSTRDERQVSITRQEKLGREWATANHPDAEVAIFADNAVSGMNMERPGWTAFVHAVRKGQVDTVCTYEQSRLTRAGSATWEEVCVMLVAAGIEEVHTHRQGIISVTEGNRLHGRIHAVFDLEERERARLRVLDALNELAEQGRPHGYPGFGYQRTLDDEGKAALAPDVQQAEVVRWMVEQIAEGSSLGLVARTLVDRQVPTLRGGKWTAAAVKAIVTAPRIVGLRVHRGKIVGDAKWPAIVDRDLWDQAQARLATNRPGRTADRRRRYLLTGGLAVCDGCGTPLISVRANGEPAYGCPHPSRPDGGCGHCSIVARHLEPHVLDVVGGWLADPVFTDELNRFLARGAADATPIRTELAEVEAKLAHLAEQWAAGEVLDFENTAARRLLLARRGVLLDDLSRLPVVPVVASGDLADAWGQAVEAGDVGALRGIVEVVARPIRVRSAFDDGRRLAVADRTEIHPIWA